MGSKCSKVQGIKDLEKRLQDEVEGSVIAKKCTTYDLQHSKKREKRMGSQTAARDGTMVFGTENSRQIICAGARSREQEYGVRMRQGRMDGEK